MNNKEKSAKVFIRLLQIMDDLRDKCPWDKKQTNETLRKLTIEETYELADAIISRDDDAIRGELGDLMLHIAFYAKLGEEKGAFDMTDILNGICQKLIYRHPHVFGDSKVNDDKDVVVNWEKLKTNEQDEYRRVLSGVPDSLPATIKANRIQEKVAGVGFDWEKPEQVWDKVKEEYLELAKEIKDKNKEKIEDEFGDLFFALINASRLYGVDPEAALEKTNRRFIKRFNYLESETIKKGRSLHDMTLAQMDKIWEEAKIWEKNGENT